MYPLIVGPKSLQRPMNPLPLLTLTCNLGWIVIKGDIIECLIA